MEHCNTVSSVMWLSLNSVLRLGRTLRCGAVPHMVGAQPVQVAEILKQRERVTSRQIMTTTARYLRVIQLVLKINFCHLEEGSTGE